MHRTSPGEIRRSSPGSVVGRVVLLLAGCTIATVCYALTIRVGLGLGPLFVLQTGIARHLGIAVGTSVTLVGFALIALSMCLRSWPGPGTLAVPVVSGVTLDAVLPHVPTLHAVVLRTVVVVVATALMALGGSMMIRASIGVSPYDAVMLGLARTSQRPLAPIRLTMEATALAAGWSLGGAVGVGTVITGVLIGPAIHCWLRVIDPDGPVRGGSARSHAPVRAIRAQVNPLTADSGS